VLALRAPQAAQALGISPSAFHDYVSDGWLPKGRRLKGCVVWPVDELKKALEQLPVAE